MVGVKDMPHYTWEAVVSVGGNAGTAFSSGTQTVKATGKVVITVTWTEQPRYMLSVTDAKSRTTVKRGGDTSRASYHAGFLPQRGVYH